MIHKTNILNISFITIMTLVFSQSAYCQKEKSEVRSGNRDFNKDNYHDAEIKYRKALEEKPLMIEAEFNLGNSLYMQENYSEAALSYLATAERAENNKLKSSSFYNLGNSFYKEGKYAEAVAAYKESLRKLPTDEARYNLEMAKKMLQQNGQDQQQSDENKESDQSQEQEGQNSQNQEEQGKNEQSEQQQAQQDESKGGEEKEQQQAQQVEISEEDAERILEALKNEEQQTMSRILEQKHKDQKVKIDKDW
ncbi:MAG: tetratricopeptide repeat protein [Bacteroidales bacterium]|nr:tetratricopeptide repeat protein [Bacteroidales bacterium]